MRFNFKQRRFFSQHLLRNNIQGIVWWIFKQANRKQRKQRKSREQSKQVKLTCRDPTAPQSRDTRELCCPPCSGLWQPCQNKMKWHNILATVSEQFHRIKESWKNLGLSLEERLILRLNIVKNRLPATGVVHCVAEARCVHWDIIFNYLG